MTGSETQRGFEFMTSSCASHAVRPASDWRDCARSRHISAKYSASEALTATEYAAYRRVLYPCRNGFKREIVRSMELVEWAVRKVREDPEKCEGER